MKLKSILLMRLRPIVWVSVIAAIVGGIGFLVQWEWRTNKLNRARKSLRNDVRITEIVLPSAWHQLKSPAQLDSWLKSKFDPGLCSVGDQLPTVPFFVTMDFEFDGDELVRVRVWDSVDGPSKGHVHTRGAKGDSADLPVNEKHFVRRMYLYDYRTNSGTK